MRWEDSVLGLFEDLEQQASGLHLEERDAQVGDLSQADYASVPWASRLYASTGQDLVFDLLGGRRVAGRLARVGEDWCLVADDGAGALGLEWVVRFAAVAGVVGASDRSVNEAARSVLTRLSLQSALRNLATAREECVLHLLDERTVEGRLGRVGADFVELRQRGETVLLRLDTIALIQGRG